MYWLSTKHFIPPTLTEIEFLEFCCVPCLCAPVHLEEGK